MKSFVKKKKKKNSYFWGWWWYNSVLKRYWIKASLSITSYCYLSDAIISLGMESATWKEVLRKSMKQPWGRQRAILLYFLHTMDLQVAQPVIFMIRLSWLNNLFRYFMRIKMSLSSFNWETWYPWGLDFVLWGPCFDLVQCIVFLSLQLITAGPMLLWLDCKWDGS